MLSPATFMEAHQIPGTGKVLCVVTSHNGPCRGAIGVIDPSRGNNAKEAGGDVDLSSSQTDFFNVSYEILARQGEPGKNLYTKWISTFNGQEANILQVTPRYWGSPASKLADLILSGHPDENGRTRVALGAEAQRRVFTWIDLDVPYYGTSESNHYEACGCRQLLPEHLDQVLAEVRRWRPAVASAATMEKAACRANRTSGSRTSRTTRFCWRRWHGLPAARGLIQKRVTGQQPFGPIFSGPR